GEASVSGLQRRFKIGYARAGRIMDAMEQRGVVGPHLGPKPRDVIINPAAMHAHLSGTEYTHPSEINLDEEDLTPEEPFSGAPGEGADDDGDAEFHEAGATDDADDSEEPDVQVEEEEAAAESA
ncbi:MAG: DNA translocase FtsK, partial [Armatimonadota bacterium]